MTKITTQKLALLGNIIRQDVIKSIYAAQSGHPAGSLGMADIITVLYFYSLRHNPKNPKWNARDRLILSNGHICPVLYAALARAKYFSVSTLPTLRKLGSHLQGHPHRGELPGIETSSGPLGSGLSQGIGMALAAKMDKKHHRIIVLGSDGEHQEGNVWEAVMCAAKYTLDNLVYIIDRNYIQIEGNTEEVMPLDSLAKKYKAFNWHVLEINGHRYEEIINAIAAAQRIQGKPVVIIARTIPGKGVKYMENDYQWHGKAPNNTETEQALQELQQVRHQIEENAYEY